VKILIDFEDILNKYWGVPLATIDDIKTIATLESPKFLLWLSENEKKLINKKGYLQLENLIKKSERITMLDTRPTNRKLWYSQFFKTYNGIETDFYYTCHFPATKIKSAKKIIRIHDPFSDSSKSWKEFIKQDKLKNRIARAIRNESFKAASGESHIICNTNFTAKKLSEIYNLPLSEILVIPYGFDWQSFESIEEKRSTIHIKEDYFLMISGLRGNKRPDIVINAWANSNLNLPKLIVVGSIPLHSLSENSRTQLSNGRLIIKNFVSQAELEILKLNSNAMIFASSYEGFGRPVIEALIAGVPSIANTLEVFEEISQGCVDFFSLKEPMSIEPLLIKYSQKISKAKSKFLIEKTKLYSYENVGHQWGSILNHCA